MKKAIITGNTGDLNVLKSNPHVKEYEIMSVNKHNVLDEQQIKQIKNDDIDELIMLLSTDQQQRSFFHKHKDLFQKMNFGFVHFLNGETIKFTLDHRGDDFINTLLQNRVTTTNK